jgi:hypothetical protein
VIHAEWGQLGRTQKASRCAHLGLTHFRLKGPTDPVKLSLNMLELTSELQDVGYRVRAVLGRQLSLPRLHCTANLNG